ncbi:MAG: hypothetical protein FD125_2847 [bacterium]|nr:MAG: hypothetical protein FD125_2847 [bacterium]
MREAAKPDDDRMMMLGPAVVRLAVHPGLEQFELPVLIGAILRMLERQVEEPADISIGPQVVPGLQGASGEQPRQRIRREGMARAPEHVARILVQQHQQGERALGCFRPVIEVAPRGGEMRVPETAPETGVKGVILGEPFAGTGLFPEGDDGGRRYVCAHDRIPRHAAFRLP